MTPLFEHNTQVKSLFQLPRSDYLNELALEISRQSSKLGGILHPITRKAILKLFNQIDSYYSALVDGQPLSLLDIQNAVKKQYDNDPQKRKNQKESINHIEIINSIRTILKSNPSKKICHMNFINWLCSAFHQNPLDPHLLMQNSHFKDYSIGSLLHIFEETFDPDKFNMLQKIMAMSASHYCLLKFHPFLHNNPAIVRLFSVAFVNKIGIDGEGLWSLSRGFANHRFYNSNFFKEQEMSSSAALTKHCEFFLEMVLAQIDFSRNILEPKNFEKRMTQYVDDLDKRGELPPQTANLLIAALLQGEINREEIPHITGLSEDSARNLVSKCLEKELLSAENPKATVVLKFPVEVVEYYFPNLYLVK